MEPSRDELERRLAALDEAIVMLRAEFPSREQLRTAFVAAADDIVAIAGQHRAHVLARLHGILVANGLNTPETNSAVT
ncbi:hypothetical protein ACFW0P_16580 [Lysobacter soli]|jgi:hypothetical protein|uniref:hypothetical protein n=1 Tax=Lysobacter soli TaxID=453783 RepID=UPI0018DD3D16